LEYKESCTSNNNPPYNIYLDNYKSKYNVESVPIFELLQWDANQNTFVHAAYGVVCAYSNVTGNVDHTAFFEAKGGWGCYLTGQSHSSSLHLTFDEYMSDGLHSLIPNNTLSCLTVYQGEAPDGWGNQCFYYIPGETYEQAINHAENNNDQTPGWGHWAGNSNSHATLFYKKGSGQNDVWDVTIDGSTDFTNIWTTVVDPSKTHYFSHRQ
jgi:hypothetical protein